MIEFKGYLTGNALKQLRKNYFKLMWSIITVASLLCLIIMLYLLLDVSFWHIAVLLIMPVYLVFPILFPYLFMKFDKTHIPKQISIQDDVIVCITDEIGPNSRKIELFKEVRDYGEYYYLKSKGLNIPPHFICQKDLLIQGSIEEFENLFAGKIKRM